MPATQPVQTTQRPIPGTRDQATMPFNAFCTAQGASYRPAAKVAINLPAQCHITMVDVKAVVRGDFSSLLAVLWHPNKHLCRRGAV